MDSCFPSAHACPLGRRHAQGSGLVSGETEIEPQEREHGPFLLGAFRELGGLSGRKSCVQAGGVGDLGGPGPGPPASRPVLSPSWRQSLDFLQRARPGPRPLPSGLSLSRAKSGSVGHGLDRTRLRVSRARPRGTSYTKHVRVPGVWAASCARPARVAVPVTTNLPDQLSSAASILRSPRPYGKLSSLPAERRGLRALKTTTPTRH